MVKAKIRKSNSETTHSINCQRLSTCKLSSCCVILQCFYIWFSQPIWPFYSHCFLYYYERNVTLVSLVRLFACLFIRSYIRSFTHSHGFFSCYCCYRCCCCKLVKNIWITKKKRHRHDLSFRHCQNIYYFLLAFCCLYTRLFTCSLLMSLWFSGISLSRPHILFLYMSLSLSVCVRC